MEKLCLLTGQQNSLFRQLVANLLQDLASDLTLHESCVADFTGFMEEVSTIQPDMILLEDSSPFSEDSHLARLLINKPELPVIVISEDSNVMYVLRCETSLLSTSHDLIDAINSL